MTNQRYSGQLFLVNESKNVRYKIPRVITASGTI
jgi:hypothetical protein